MRIENVSREALSLLVGAALTLSPQSPTFAGPSGAFSLSHDKLDAALGRHVRDGLVDYASLKGDADFQRYLDLLAATDPAALSSQQERLAFWINAYNALAIKGVIDRYPIRSVTEVGEPGKWSFFSGIEHAIGGGRLTLDRIEHGIIRPLLEPRAHFALVCASRSCPKLRSAAYHPDRLEFELEQASRQFINDPEKVRFDEKAGILYLSSVFKWYGDDFANKPGGAVGFIARYLGRELPPNPKIEYLDYSWALNDWRSAASR